jgi:protein-disulfide isomerase
MANRRATIKRYNGRQSPKVNQRMFVFLSILGLLMILVISSLAALGRNATTERNAANAAPVAIADHPSPPNAEPNGRAWGPKDAPIQVIEYVDYECEACGEFARVYEQDVVAAFANTGNVRFEIRNAPFHGPGARNAAEGAYCAAEQNAFWPMHDSLFLNQPTSHAEGAGIAAFNDERLNTIAAKLQLDTAAFEQCLASNTYVPQVEADYNATTQVGVSRTPTFIINGKTYLGVMDVNEFRRIFSEIAPEVRFGS